MKPQKRKKRIPKIPEKRQNVIGKEDAKKILAADLKNIVAKVQAGKPLTSRERRTIRQAAEEKTIAKTVGELQALLGLTRSQYYKLKNKDGHPEGLDLEEWREFISLAQVGAAGSRHITPAELSQLKGRLLAERTARETIERKLKELKLEREAGGWIPFAEAEEAITRVLEPLNRLLDGIPKKYAMRVNPADSDHAEIMLREMVVDIKEQVIATRGQKISKRKGVK